MFRLCLYASRPAGYECGEYKDAEPDCSTNGAPDKIEYFGGERRSKSEHFLPEREV